MEINLQGLIPPVDEVQIHSISLKIQKLITQPLYEDGRITLYRETWTPQHITAICDKLEERGYVIDYDCNRLHISTPEFDIVEVGIPPIEEPDNELIEYIITEDTDGDDI